MKTTLKLTVLALFLASPAVLAQSKPAEKQPTSATAPAAAEATQETSEGAVKLFVAAMKKGDFHRVVELTDPGSVAYNDLQEMAAAMDPETANPNIQKAELDIIRDFFTKPWQDVEHKLVAEQGHRAQFKLHFYTTDAQSKQRKLTGERTVDLNQFEGQWRVLVSPDLMRPSAPASTPTAPAQSSEPSDKPAEKPADQQ
ncbi:MAG: hypothetical protein SFZ24_00720 [Planctomycetota bacterium]|nr:hypothetical protein [Planctomycetota bacterium]